MKEAMEYGNHKSAKENEELCVELASKDATLGYSAVFPVSCAEKIANGEIYPLGIQFQNAVNEFGEIYEKARLTHDLSFPKDKPSYTKAVVIRKRKLHDIENTYPNLKNQKGPNLNSRCNMDNLIPCIYGQALKCTCNIVQQLRILHRLVRMLG